MKKIITGTLITGLLLFGVGCGGGSSWSDQDKEDLSEGLFAAEALGIFTDEQADCVSKYLQDNYDSFKDVENAPESDGDKMFKACDIDIEDLENWSLFGEETEDPEIYEPTTTTTTAPDISTLQNELDDRCYGEIWDGIQEISDNSVYLAELSGTSASASTRATLAEAVKTMRNSVSVCVGIVPTEVTDNMTDFVDATEKLINLHINP